MIAVGITDQLPASGTVREPAYTVEGMPADSWKLQFSMLSTTYGDFQAKSRSRCSRAGISPWRTAPRSASGDREPVDGQTVWPGQRAIEADACRQSEEGAAVGNCGWRRCRCKFGPRDEPGVAQWYAPALQAAILFGSQTSGTIVDAVGGCITLRSALPPEQMAQTLRAAIAEIDPLLALQQVQP